MRTIISLYLLISIQLCFAQDSISEAKPIDLNKIYKEKEVDVKPEFPGGWIAFWDFVRTNYEHYESDITSGKLELTVITEKDGTVLSVKTSKPKNSGAAARLFLLMREKIKFYPAKINNTPVRCSFIKAIIKDSCQ